MDFSELKDFLPILFERFNSTLTLWNFQMAVILGLIGFLAAARVILRDWRLHLGLSVAYLGFAVPNFCYLRAGRRRAQSAR